jgi:hypothetical protein
VARRPSSARNALARLVAVALLTTISAGCTTDPKAPPPNAEPNPATTPTSASAATPVPTSTSTTVPVAIDAMGMVLTDGQGDPGRLVAELRRRFGIFGSGGVFAATVADRVVIALPGEPDSASWTILATSVGQLVVRPVLALVPSCLPPASTAAAPTTGGLAVLPFRDPAQGCARVGPGVALGVDHADAFVVRGRWTVDITVTPDGLARLNEMAPPCFAADASCAGGRLAVVLDGTVLAAPLALDSGWTQSDIAIPGPFADVEARRLAALASPTPLAAPPRVIVPMVPVVRRIVGDSTVAGAAVAVLVRYGPNDGKPSAALARLTSGLEVRLRGLGLTAAFLSADDDAGVVTVFAVGADSPSVLGQAVAAAGAIDDASRLVVSSGRVS